MLCWTPLGPSAAAAATAAASLLTCPLQPREVGRARPMGVVDITWKWAFSSSSSFLKLSLSLFFFSISSSFLPGRRIKTIFEEIFLLKRFARGVRTSLIKWSASQRRGTFSTLYHWNHWRYQTRDVSVFRAHPPLRYYIATDDVNLLMPQSATTTTTREKEKRGTWTSITETLMRRRQRPEAIRDEREYPIEVITIAVETAKTAKMAESMSGQQQQRLGQQKLRKGAAAMKPNNIKSWYRLALGKRIVRWTSSSSLLLFFLNYN